MTQEPDSTMNQEQFDLTKKLVKAQEEVELKFEANPNSDTRKEGKDLQVYGGSETCRAITKFMDDHGLDFLNSPDLDLDTIMELNDIIWWATISLPEQVMLNPNNLYNQILDLIEPQLP